jgi:hypothetical protein
MKFSFLQVFRPEILTAATLATLKSRDFSFQTGPELHMYVWGAAKIMLRHKAL